MSSPAYSRPLPTRCRVPSSSLAATQRGVPSTNSEGLLSSEMRLQLRELFERQHRRIGRQRRFRELMDRTGLGRAPCVMAATALSYLAAVVACMLLGFSGLVPMVLVSLVAGAVLGAGAWVMLGKDDEMLDELTGACDQELELLGRYNLQQK